MWRNSTLLFLNSIISFSIFNSYFIPAWLHHARFKSTRNVWENEKLKWKHERAGRVLPNFHDSLHEKRPLYQIVNSPHRSRWRMWWRIMARIFPCLPCIYTVLVKTYSFIIGNGAIWLATLLAIYSSIDT